jgi:hypothetical protein
VSPFTGDFRFHFQACRYHTLRPVCMQRRKLHSESYILKWLDARCGLVHILGTVHVGKSMWHGRSFKWRPVREGRILRPIVD